MTGCWLWGRPQNRDRKYGEHVDRTILERRDTEMIDAVTKTLKKINYAA